MKIRHFSETDTLAIELTTKTVATTDTITDDLILDYDNDGKLVAITLDNYSQNVETVNLQALGVTFKFLPLLHDLPKQPFFIVYDAEADVLYIDFNNPPQTAQDSELTDDNIVIRYDDAEAIVGLTILNASQR
jgi:uncharacterized protein YuzE